MSTISNDRNPALRYGCRTAAPVVACIVMVLAAGALGAQTVPTGVQEYFILGWEQHIWDMMDRVQNAEGGAQFDDGMNSVITATASADNQLIFYDHWEDGLDPALAAFPAVTPPLQLSTLVIGDADDTNGEACDFNANIACGSANDVVAGGNYVNFNSDQGLVSNGDPLCAVPSANPAYTQLCNAVELNPRCAVLGACTSSEFRFDGGDMIRTTGGPLSLIHSQYPLTNFIGGSTEILSRQAVEAARSYSVPIGEDLYVNNTVTEPFHYVELDLVAFEDTQITVESPGAGTVSFSLGRGEHWSSMGFIDDDPFPALELTINAGTKVSTTAPIAGMIFTGGNGTWATRHYALLPDILHSTDYVTTAPGDDPAIGNPADRPANVYILNPDQLTSIDVSITDSSGTYSVTIPPNQMRSMDDIGGGRDIAPGSTVRMTSDRNFWGVTAYDWNTNVSDWGHSWLAKKFLTRTYTVSFGPGNQDPTNPGPPPAGTLYANPVFVAATEDRTRVQFDLDNDGAYDLVDLDADGAANAADDPATNTYFLSTPAAFKVWDPVDNDMTGTRIIANKPIAVSWGQETENTEYSDWALDTGFTIYPVNQLFLDPALVIDKVNDINVVPIDPADPDERIVTYTLTIRSYDFGPLTQAEVFDLLPTGVTGADYIPGSTLITYPNLVQDTVEPVASIEASGRHRLDWPLTSAPPWDPGDPPFSFGLNNTITVRYQVRIPAAPGGIPRLLVNEGHAEARLGGSTFSPFDSAQVVQTDVELTKSVSDNNPGPGDVITFTINVLNDGVTDETGVFISDAIPPDTTFCNATIDPVNCSNPTGTAPFTSGTFYPAQNAVIWTAGTLAAGQSATLTFDVRVNPTTPAGTRIPNRAGYESNETPYFLSNEVEPVVEGAALTAVKSIIGDPPFVHPYEVVTFNIRIANSGSAAATNLIIIDPFPTNATYVPGSMQWSLNSGAFTPLTDAADGDEGLVNASNVEFRLASLGVAENINLRFKAVVDPGTSGDFLFNQALFASDETPSTDTNAVQVPIVGNATINGHVFLDLNGNGVDDGEPPIPNVDVVVSSTAPKTYSCVPGVAIPDDGYDGSQGSMACCSISVPAGDFGAAPLITDLNVDMAATHTYVGDLTIKLFAPGGQVLAMLNRPGSFAPDDGTDTPFGDSSNWSNATITFDDQGGGPSAELMGAGIGGAGSICTGNGVCNHVPAPDTAAGLPDLAGFNGTDPRGLWSVCMGDSAGGAAGTFNSSVLSFITNESTVTTQIVTTDAGGDYTAVVAGTAATLNVNETDPDFPPGAVLTTATGCASPPAPPCNDPQTIATVPFGSVNAPDVGYQQPALIFTKTSDALNHEVSPGQTVTYTLEITNNTGVTQTGIVVTDAVPTGTTYVPGSSQISVPAAPVSVRVSNDDDDAEESVSDGSMDLGSSDLEIVFEGGNQQYVGMRFLNVAIPQGATIASAEIEFETDELDSGTTNVLIYGQDADDTSTFTNTDYDISSRPATTATVAWAPPPWTTVSEKHVTPDISSIIQEIVNRPGWVSGNDMVIMIEAGPGCSSSACQRTAESHDGESANAPLLRVSLAASAAVGDPPNPLDGTEGYTLAAGGTITLSFQVVVDDPLAAGITQIINSATLNTNQQGPFNASVIDNVIRAGVVVEYDNAGFDLAGQTATYAHEVTNTGAGDDSFEITMTKKVGWRVDLVDPDTGAVIASDTNGDGVWDLGVTINTGTLAPGESVEYELRVTIPPGASAGDAESTGLVATSDRNLRVTGIATDETVAVDALDPVIFLPDNSGVASQGGSIAYSHRVLNNTGAPETFDLTAVSLATPTPWAATYYWDSNGDGVYTDGVDIAITNTRQLAQGESQLVFLVVDVPGGTPDLTVDVAYLAALARSDPDNVFATATDTTTVEPPVILDLSGGGTRSVAAGDTAVFPGTVRNFTTASDVLNFGITESWFFGFDGLVHPTQLWIDTNSDGTPDTQIAEDADGNGTWDTIAPGYDTDSNNLPDVTMAANSELAYELRRPVDPLQGTSRDPVTLTAYSTNTTQQDSVTATVLLAAPTRAILASFDASAVNGRVVVEWRTAAEIGTLGFDLLRRREGEGRYNRVNDSLIRGVGGHLQGGTYSLLDLGVVAGETVTYVLMERDVWGAGTRLGPFTVTVGRREVSKKHAQVLAAGSSRTVNTSSVRHPSVEKATVIGARSGMAKVLVRERGLVWAPAEQLAKALAVDPTTVSNWIGAGNLWLGTDSRPVVADDDISIFSDGFESGSTGRWAPQDESTDARPGIAWLAAGDNSGLYFFGEPIESIYTPDNVYWLGIGRGRTMAARNAWVDDVGAEGSFDETLHFEEDAWPLTSVMADPEADYWMWDYFFPAEGEPVVSKTFVLASPGVAPSSDTARLTVNLQGSFRAPVPLNHRVELRVNGTQLGGTFSWTGHDAYFLEAKFPQSLLNDGDNTVELKALLADGLDFDEFYLDSFDLEYRRRLRAHDDRLLASTSGDAVVAVRGFTTSDISVFDLRDPQRPVVLEPVKIVSGDDGYVVSFASGGAVFPFLATTSDASQPVAGIVADVASNLSDPGNRGRWVVVAGEGFEGEAALLAAHRAGHGLSAVVAPVTDIYDEFNGGIVSPWAIREFLLYASENWAEPPAYVFLAGDGSLDHKNIWGAADDLVPAPMAVTRHGLVPSDNLLVDWVGNDGVPEISIGRFPAQTAGELKAYTLKVKAFEAASGSWDRSALWLEDDPDEGGYFIDDVDNLIALLPADYSSERISLDDLEPAEAAGETLERFGKGVLLVSFLGHGGFDRLAEEGLLVTEGATELENAERTPFLEALTCVVGRFDVPGYDTLAEALLLNEGGGAIGVWSPSGYSMNADATLLGKEHLAAIASGSYTTIGDAVRAALQAYVAAGEGDGALPQKFILLGDPAVRVDW